MKISGITKALLSLATILVCATGVVSLSSCDRLEENLPECEQGLRLRFTYTYNMEFGNAFPAQVDCLTLFIYNSEGKLMATRTETSSVLSDENYRMTVTLPDGDYRLVAYGGLQCLASSFEIKPYPSENSSITLPEVSLLPSQLEKGTLLHNLFYGYATATVTSEENKYCEATVDMMRDTNNIRIMLQNVNGSPINDLDFNFSITDNNTLMAWDNELLPSPEVTYLPWNRGTLPVGVNPDGSDVTMAYAEFSLCRLVTDNDPYLLITRSSDDHKVVSLPLINYLLAQKSEVYAKMPAQEYLDREHDWAMTFFLDSNTTWLYVEILVGNWVVRINNIDN